MSQQPLVMGQIIRDALSAWLKSEDEKRAKATKVFDEDEIITSKSQKIGRLLSAVFKPQENLNKIVIAEVAVDFLVLAHHPEIGEDAQVSWISLVQNLGLDPATIAFEQQEKVLDALWTAASAPPDVRVFCLRNTLLTSRMLDSPKQLTERLLPLRSSTQRCTSILS